MAKPVATNLQYVGGAAAILGLVAMASDVEGLYAAVKALVCVVKSNPLASKEMERIKGYQVRDSAPLKEAFVITCPQVATCQHINNCFRCLKSTLLPGLKYILSLTFICIFSNFASII